jgi:NAD+ diphosphatase
VVSTETQDAGTRRDETRVAGPRASSSADSADPGSAPASPAVRPPLSRSGHDRNAELRLDELGLAAAWSSPDTRVLVVCQGQALVVDEPDPDLPDTDRTRLITVPVYDAPEGDRYLLGRDERGAMYFAVPVESLPGRLDGDARPASLREVGALLDDRDAALFAHAVALEHWHASHGFCPNCGNPTDLAAAGHLRRCARCGREHYPRTDPAVIMAVTDRPADDPEARLLLGRNAAWEPGRFSVLAGFVEPGESLEQAVAREVAEEAALTVTQAIYLGSQPWPFPASIMLGFTALVADPERTTADGNEMRELRWYGRAGLAEAIRAGEIRAANRLSIARALIEHWYGGTLPDARGRG